MRVKYQSPATSSYLDFPDHLGEEENDSGRGETEPRELLSPSINCEVQYADVIEAGFEIVNAQHKPR